MYAPGLRHPANRKTMGGAPRPQQRKDQEAKTAARVGSRGGGKGIGDGEEGGEDGAGSDWEAGRSGGSKEDAGWGWLCVGGRKVWPGKGGGADNLSTPWLQARCILGKSRQNAYKQIQNEIPMVEGIAVLSSLSTRPRGLALWVS